jgi:DNA ligase D-like protein (predicted 3'-phosphoesterase)
MNNLKKYKQKRDFNKTTEPSKSKTNQEKIFVVQKHDARNLHYDFRFQLGKVLKSWAVPKGIPDKDNDKRLAVQTEDHPLDYANFEGIIPEGNYGAGTVEIWDKGHFNNIRKVSLSKSIEEGKIEINIKGRKLDGNYALVKLRPTIKYPGDKNWLIMKMKNKFK